MSVPIRIRRRQSGSAGAPGVLRSSELAFNEVDGILYYGKGADQNGNATQIVGIGGNASSSYADGLIATEQAAREAADQALASDISTLTTDLGSEVSRATAAEQALGTRIDNVLSNVDGSALDSLSEVVAAFEAADSNLNGAITSLASSASSALTAEVNRATAAETALASRATSLEGRATTAEANITSNASAISAETSARQSAITSVQSSISSETSARQSAITSVENSISSVSDRLLVLETEIDGGSF